MSSRFVILTWHSIRVLDHDRESNDLVAFSEDLRLIDRLGWTILPLADALERQQHDRLPEKTVVLTLDDGSIMDFCSFEHPTLGPQRGIFERLKAFADDPKTSANHQIHASTFVIASPQARNELDERDYQSLGLWPDNWWAKATRTGLMNIESHTWDHNHASLTRTAQRENRRGDFRLIETEPECRAEIDRASDYIEQRAGRRPRFLAYPYGQASEFLRYEYLPTNAERLGLSAAVSCQPEPVTATSDCWYLPRYVCGQDWQKESELRALLNDAETHPLAASRGG